MKGDETNQNVITANQSIHSIFEKLKIREQENIDLKNQQTQLINKIEMLINKNEILIKKTSDLENLNSEQMTRIENQEIIIQ